MKFLKVVLKKELVDGCADCGALAAVCPQLTEWHEKVEPVIGSEYSRNWLRELKNDSSSLARAISDVYLAKLRKFMEKRGVWSECFLTLEVDYTLKAVPEMEEALKGYRQATDDKELLSAYMAEVVMRRWGRWVEGQDIEVTGCRFKIVPDGETETITDEQQKIVREYLACFGYAKSADTPEEVSRFIRRLEKDVPEIDDVVEVVWEKTIRDVDFELMEKHAWKLFAERERILADENFAGTKVNIQSGAAPAAFSLPSIATYLHFWQTDKGMVERDGRRGLIIRVAGIGLSGTNSCSVVWEDGTSGHISVEPFNETWSPFLDILRKYPPKEDCCTLEELIRIINQNK